MPDIEREFGTPLVNKLFEAAQEHASHRIVAYVNADIILFEISYGVCRRSGRIYRSSFSSGSGGI